MKFISKLKEIPKKKIAMVCLIVLLIAATVCVSYMAAKASYEPSRGSTSDGESNTQTDNISVFKPVEDSDSSGENSSEQNTDPVQTVPPLNHTGADGLSFVSQGNGTCYIDGIGTCTDTELKIPTYSPSGDRVTRIGDGAFTNCTSLLSVSIPSSVKTIGTGVFRGCSSLVSISVDSANEVYSSIAGVLMSKDKSVLICIPMNRPGSSYLLNPDTKVIAAYAFDGVLHLKTLLYEGKVSEFQKIDILIGNANLDKISITCNYNAGK